MNFKEWWNKNAPITSNTNIRELCENAFNVGHDQGWHNRKKAELRFSYGPSMPFSKRDKEQAEQRCNRKESEVKPFKAEDKVFDIIMMEVGKVEELTSEKYPVLVRFGKYTETYTSEGLYNWTDKQRRLYHLGEKVVINIPEAKKKVQKWKWRFHVFDTSIEFTTPHMSEDEAYNMCDVFNREVRYYKFSDTLIEVEE